LDLPEKDAAVVIAVSGGADSVALFLALNELVKAERLLIDLIVAHFNHGLREEAKGDADWVKNLVEKFKIEFVSGEGDILSQSKETKDNLEQAARHARYDFLCDVALKNKASIIVTAHTMDDQAETVLLRLIRGSGADGLGGIEPISVLEIQDSRFKIQNSKRIRNPQSAIRNPLLVRPLLSWARRDDTESFCRKHGIDFRLDAMNESVRFARVRVRKELLPMMKSYNGRIVETLARTAEILREDSAELDSQAMKLLTEASDDKSESRAAPLCVKVLLQASVSLRRRALRLWIEEGKGNLRRLEMAHILQVESLLKGEQGGRIVILPGGCKIERRKGFINFILQKS